MKPALSLPQKQLARHCYWDPEAQNLWIDCRQWFPHYGVFAILSWDAMMMSAEPIPNYPKDLQILDWSNQPQLAFWRKQIPNWVAESCALFPSHQLRLLHFVGRYPQLLELLDHSPVLAWRLVTSNLSEAEIVKLMQDKRTELVAKLGWPGSQDAVQFLRKLRLRFVTPEIADSLETCLLDEGRLQGLQALPRVNSMALSLAVRFPKLIGSRLHQSLAQLPCRPLQCQKMIALLEDVYRGAEHLQPPESDLAKIGCARYLVEVEKIYQAWWFLAAQQATQSMELALTERPSCLTERWQWLALSGLQQHYWLTDWADFETGKLRLWARCSEQGIEAILQQQDKRDEGEGVGQLIRGRQQDNELLNAEQLSFWHCWLTAEQS